MFYQEFDIFITAIYHYFTDSLNIDISTHRDHVPTTHTETSVAQCLWP